jgi:transposase
MRQKRYGPAHSGPSGNGQPLFHDRSQAELPPCYHVLDAILHVVKPGTQWRVLPNEFTPYQTL